MSGGFFDYKQHKITEIADSIEELISGKVNDYGEIRHYEFGEKEVGVFKEAVIALRKAAIYAQRIDWLVSGDDGEESFHARLAEELGDLNGKTNA